MTYGRRPGGGGRGSSDRGASGAGSPFTPGKRTLTEVLPAMQADRVRAQPPPTIHDVATATVENKGTGSPVDPALRAGVEGVLGIPVPEARVHQDANAQAGATAIGARAFAHGTDIVPVKTSAGADAVISVEMPWRPDATGKLDEIPTWWLAKSNFAKGGAFNP